MCVWFSFLAPTVGSASVSVDETRAVTNGSVVCRVCATVDNGSKWYLVGIVDYDGMRVGSNHKKNVEKAKNRISRMHPTIHKNHNNNLRILDHNMNDHNMNNNLLTSLELLTVKKRSHSFYQIVASTTQSRVGYRACVRTAVYNRDGRYL